MESEICFLIVKYLHISIIIIVVSFLVACNWQLMSQTNIVILFQNREPLMPSPQFIKSYFSSFTDDIISQPLLRGEKSDEDKDKEGEASVVKEK